MNNLFESYVDELEFLGDSKVENNLTWQNIADQLNEKYGFLYSTDKYRKQYYAMKVSMYDDEYEQETALTEQVNELIYECKKERVKLADERTQTAAYVRRASREDSIVEIAKEFISHMNEVKYLEPYHAEDSDDEATKVAILQLSDWHYGIEIDNAWNKFNPEICKERVNKLQNEVIEYCTKNNIKDLIVLNLSDLIAGNIHLQLRLESRINVVQQVIEVSEILAEFIYNLSEHFNITYFDCLDNHSRLDPNKKDALQLESLAEIIHWHIKNRFEGHEKISIVENPISRDIITFRLFNWNIAAVHGDLDKQKDVVERLSLMTRNNYDIVFTAHQHHFSADERNQCAVISNPSLMGTDAFAEKLRLSSLPAQNLIIATKNNPVDIIKRIIL